MNRAVVRICLLAGVMSLASCTRNATDPAATAPVDAPVPEAGPGVSVEPEDVARMGIELAPVDVATSGAVATGTAIVLDGESFAAALDEFSSARAEAQAQSRSLERLSGLRAEGNASEQALEGARSQAAAARARLSATEAKTRADWGAELVDVDTTALQTLRTQMRQRRAALLRAEFSGALPADPAQLEYTVELPVSPSAGAAAKFIGVSHAAATAAFGTAVTLTVPAEAAHGAQPRPGARLPVTAATREGPARAMVPEGAAIADGGQLWCYVERPEGRFDRVPLDAGQRSGAQYPAQDLQAGDRVVVRGASLLLSLERGAGATEPASSGDED